jgi:hypothetical protein
MKGRENAHVQSQRDNAQDSIGSIPGPLAETARSRQPDRSSLTVTLKNSIRGPHSPNTASRTRSDEREHVEQTERRH